MQISPAHSQAAALSAGRCLASALLLNASAMAAELWQWMDGQTLVGESARHSRLITQVPRFSRPRAARSGRSARPLGQIMYTTRQKIMPENIILHSLS